MLTESSISNTPTVTSLTALVEVDQVTKSFGKKVALKDVRMALRYTHATDEAKPSS